MSVVIFFRESFKISSRSSLMFRGLNLEFFLGSVHCLGGKGKQNSIVEQQQCKGHEKRDRFLFAKEDFNFQVSQRNKNFTH